MGVRRRYRCGESWTGGDVDVGVIVVMGVRKVGKFIFRCRKGDLIVKKM